MSSPVAQLIAVARGEQAADLVLANARIINVFTGEIESGNVAICADRIAGIGDYTKAKQVIDLQGKYLSPGLINGHTHLESSMLDVGQYARAVVPHGTSAIVSDLHEIANVSGMSGIKYVLDCARHLPLDLFLMAPSCVPATHLETAGAAITPADIRRILRWRGCIGLGEMMNFPGVLGADNAVLEKIAAAGSKPVDGHAPGLSGKNLNAYLSAGIGSDHESVALAEAAEKLRRGMFVMIREGSSEKNLDVLLPLVTDKTWPRCLFVVDDRSCADLLRDGDIDAVVRKAVRRGLEPVRALQLATINPARYFRLNGLGAVAPGYFANLVVFDNLKDLTVNTVYYRGKPVARGGEPLFAAYQCEANKPINTVNLKPFTAANLKIKPLGESQPVIEVVPGQIVTRQRRETVKIVDGAVVPDVSRDLLKLVVVERHQATGNIGTALVTGFGLQRGALATSIAHDSHNIVAVGVSDEDIIAAVKEIERLQGGLAVAARGKILASLGLPIAGLLSAEPLEQVVSKAEKLEQLAKDLGATLPAPFAALSFLALPVIPELRLTDRGLVDVNQFRIIS